jgi:hypothetical protein
VQERLLGRTEGKTARDKERRTLSELLVRSSGGQPPLKAAALARRAVDEDGRFAPGHAVLGDALAAAGQEGEGIRAWLKGYKATGQRGLLLKIEELKLRRGEGEDMLRLYRKLAKKDGALTIFRARLLVALNRSEEALEALGTPPPPSRLGRWIAGEALFRLRSYDGAARSFRQSLRAEEGAPPLDFKCRRCGNTERTWGVACGACGALDALELDAADRAG